MSLNDIDLHLLFAVSGLENLLIQLQDLHLLDRTCTHIANFCSSPTVNRSHHVVSQDLAHTADEVADILEQFFITADENKEKQGQIPHTLIIPSLEEYPRHLQTALKAVLRDRRFEYKKQSYNLPKDFVLIGIVTDWEKMAPYMTDAFGLSLQLDNIPSLSSTVPPLIPTQPLAYHAPMLRVYTADVLSALRHHPLLSNSLLTARCGFQHVFKIATLYARLKTLTSDYATSASGNPKDGVYAKELDIRPQDVIDVLLTCVMHRLRTRSPDERWDTFWNKEPATEERQILDDAIRSGARLRYDLILQEVLDKV